MTLYIEELKSVIYAEYRLYVLDFVMMDGIMFSVVWLSVMAPFIQWSVRSYARLSLFQKGFSF